MRSMRCVTRKPPAMLMEASRIAAAPSRTAGEAAGPLTVSMPPTTMMPLMALVTLMSGVCSAGVTFQTTCQPTIHASANTVRCDRNAEGATNPSARSAAATTTAAIAAAGLRDDSESLAATGVLGAGGAALAAAGGGGASRRGGGQTTVPLCTTNEFLTTSSFRSM